MTDDLDLKFNPDPICPHCGHKQRDAWEFDFGGAEGEIDIECGSCGEPFWVGRHIEVTYSTGKITPKP